MDEYIKRKAVISLITRRYENPEICTQEINQIPSVDVAPVVHARWEENPETGWNFCTNCGNETADDRNTGTEFLSGYCPNCGARMDGETE